MSFLNRFVPAPFGDLIPILILLIVAYIVLPKLFDRFRETEMWNDTVEKLGGEKFRLMQFERTVAKLRKSGDLIGAARLYEEAEWFPEALECYIEAGEYISAGVIYENAEDYIRAADLYAKGDDWKRAAKTYATAGQPEKAAQLFDENGQKIDAAKFYADAGAFAKAATLFEAVSYFPQAAKCYEKLNEPLKAAENYEQHWIATTSVSGGGLISAPTEREAKVALRAGKLFVEAGHPERAIQLFQRAGLTKQAAELNAQAGNFLVAAEMYLKEEQLPMAAEMYEKGGDKTRAALIKGEIAFQKNDNMAAAGFFMEGGDPLRAAELYESLGALAEAAQCYEGSGAPLQAANVYLRAKQTEKAASMFEEAREFGTAAKLYEEIGNLAKASELYEANGLHYEAGMLAKDGTDLDRGIRLLQQVDSSHEEYETAVRALCELFIKQSKPAFAEEKLKRLLSNRDVSAATIDHYYTLGAAYEGMGRTEDALSIFRKVLTERYGYKDLEQRIARLSGAEPPAAAAGGNEAPPAPVATPAAASQPRAATDAPSRYQILAELGSGLLGKTYKGKDTELNRLVCIKVPRPDVLNHPSVAQRFSQDAQIAVSLSHPGIAQFYGVAEIQGRKAIVTEFIEGMSLATFLERSKKLSVKQAVDLLNSLSKTLAHAHQQRLVHQNLKPSNIIVGSGGQLKLTGFGMGGLRVPQLGPADGFPAPEFLAGGPPDPRSDIYSLGALALHSLGGSLPSPQAPMQIPPDVPQAVVQILERCIAPDPNARFASATELMKWVESVAIPS